MTVITAARVFTPEGLIGPAVVEVEDDRIAAVTATTGPAPEVTLAPGFVDMQVNGMDDVDVSSATGDEWGRLDDLLAATGVTTWVPTIITAPLSDLEAAIARIETGMARPALGRPTIAGIHVEGPFLGGAPGAHPRQWLRGIDSRWLAALPDAVRLVTLGPELDGAIDAVRMLVEAGRIVSLGHSSASFDLAIAAADAGASMVTHVFNGMAALHHRAPGLLGAALTDDRFTVGLIADGVHVHHALLRLVFTAKTAARVALVTDAVAWRARRTGSVELRMVAGSPRLADGTLAGSALTMDRAITNIVGAGLPLSAALESASTTPARLLGLADRGRICAGARADMVTLDADFRVLSTWIGGQQVFGP